jgi:uncharacterized protein (UPF0147 family)
MGKDENSLLEETARVLDRLRVDEDVAITSINESLKQTAIMLRTHQEPEVIAKKLWGLSQNKELPYFTRVGLWRVIGSLQDLENKSK